MSLSTLPTLRRYRQYVATALPSIPSDIFFSSLAIGFGLMIILSSKSLQNVTFTRLRVPWLNFATKYFLDVGLLQIASVGFLIFVLYSYLKTKPGLPQYIVSTFSLGCLPMLLALEVLAEVFFLKPSFSYGLPRDKLSECAVTSYVAAHLGIPNGEGTAAPSGFVMRQVIILLFFLVLSHQSDWHQVFSKRANRLLHWTFYGFFVLVTLLRFYRGRHSLFDVGVGIGVAVTIFWFLGLTAAFVAKRDEHHFELIGTAVAPFGCFGMAILFYCQETSWWIVLFLSIFVIMGWLYHLGPRRGDILMRRASNDGI